jgi:hypothetical protein
VRTSTAVLLSANTPAYRSHLELLPRMYKSILNSPVSSALFGPMGENGATAFAGLYRASTSAFWSGPSGQEASLQRTSFDIFFEERQSGHGDSAFSVHTPGVGGSSGTAVSGWGIYNYEEEVEEEDSCSRLQKKSGRGSTSSLRALAARCSKVGGSDHHDDDDDDDDDEDIDDTEEEEEETDEFSNSESDSSDG